MDYIICLVHKFLLESCMKYMGMFDRQKTNCILGSSIFVDAEIVQHYIGYIGAA